MRKLNFITQFVVSLALAAGCQIFNAGVKGEVSRRSEPPSLPRLTVDTAYPSVKGRTITVGEGGNFQAALNKAQPGDVIRLAAGATFRGPFYLPKKSGSGWIIVRSAAPDSQLPRPGTRVNPSYAKAMPKLQAARGSVITAAPGAHHYRFVGIEIQPQKDVFLYNLVTLGSDERSEDQIPLHIIFDRCYLHGDPKKGTRRGIAMNGKSIAVIDSYLSDFKEVGADSQAIAGWNGPGPFKIVNNYLEGAGENVMFGGADPSIPDLIPSDIEVRHNHFFKALKWRERDPNYAGIPWTIKNIFELKNARRVLVDGNLFEHNWVQAQTGFAILFTVRNQDGKAPWSVVEDVTFTNNIVRRVSAGINILGRDNNQPSQQTKRILVKNNLFEDVGEGTWGFGRLFQILDGTVDVVIDHNTASHTEAIIAASGSPHSGFVYRNNIAQHNVPGYGVGGDGTFGNPLLTLDKYFPGYLFARNVVVGGGSSSYPGGNFFPSSLDLVRFVNRKGQDFRLSASSPFRNAGNGGKDIGVDFKSLCQALGPMVRSVTPCSSTMDRKKN